MSVTGSSAVVDAIRASAVALTGAPGDYDALLERIGDRRVVLIGEASHGTAEFYRERARITSRLIEEKEFGAVAVEADWPDAQRVNRYVQWRSPDASADESLGGFTRFPAWMWRNTEVRDFVEWLRGHNESLAMDRRVGFYGLDLYSLYGSVEAVLDYLGRVDPEAAKRAQERYACFEDFGNEAQTYGYAVAAGAVEACEEDVVQQLVELRSAGPEYAERDGRVAEEEFFSAEQNARLIANAEEYYRAMFRGRVSSWNLRDRHMAATLEQLLDHLGKGRHAAEGRRLGAQLASRRRPCDRDGGPR